MRVVYLAGYTSHCPESLKAAAERHNALVMDIRLSPYSRHPRWNYKSLREFLTTRYCWNPDWGNRNYKTGGKIEIADWETGLDAFQGTTETSEFPNVILLCACRCEAECHRTVIGERLKAQGYDVRSLLWLKPTAKKAQKKVGEPCLSI